MPGIITITDGTFNVKAKTTLAGGIVVAAAKSESGAVGTTSRIPKATVTGGNFKVESAGDANATAYAMNTLATADNLKVQGGWYNTNKTTETKIEDKYTAPTLTNNYHVLPLTDEDPYKYEVAEAYIITFKNADGTPLQSTAVKKGATPEYNGETPAKDATAKYTYTFDTWSPAISAATEAATYTATYTQTVNTYTVTWVDGDGKILKTDDVAYDETPSYSGTTPAKTEDTDNTYTFNNTWLPAITKVTADATYTAQFDAIPKDRGPYIDIIDWTGNSLTVNMNGYTGGAGWTKVKTGDTEKRPADLTAEGTLVFSGLALTADEEITIEVYDASSALESKHKYRIPQVFSADNATFSGTYAESTLWVASGKLTINGKTSVAAVYVNPGAELVINSGWTLTVSDRLVLRTEAWNAAILTDNGTVSFGSTGKMYYTRRVSDRSQAYQFGLPFATDIGNSLLSNGSKAIDISTNTYKFGIMKYNAQSRANNGKGNNWVGINPTQSDNHALAASTGYQLISTSDKYMEFYFPVTYAKTTGDKQLSVTAYRGGAAAIDQGWNYLVSPYTHRFTCNGTPEDRIKLCELYDDNKNFHQFVPEQILPAMPFHYQATESGKLKFSSDIAFTNAPGRDATARTQWLQVLYGDNRFREDETTVFLHPSKFTDGRDSRYETGKLSTSGTRPFVWSTLPYGDMAIAAITDSMAERRIPLAVYAPAAGEMYFSLRPNDWQDRLEALYLYDEQTGSVTDLLWADYTYDAAAGTVRDRFFLQPVFGSRKITTGLDNGSADDSLQLWLSGRTLFVQAEPGSEVWCFDAAGRLVGRAAAEAGRLRFELPAEGVYLLRSGAAVQRILITY